MTPGEILDELEREGWLRLSPLIVRSGPVSVRLTYSDGSPEGWLVVMATGVEVDRDHALDMARALAALYTDAPA